MTIARKSVFAGVVVSLGVLAACQSAGPGGPGTAATGVEKRLCCRVFCVASALRSSNCLDKRCGIGAKAGGMDVLIVFTP